MSIHNKKQSVTIPGNQTEIRAVGLTDTGLVRDHNEDAFSILKDVGLFIVSDGMGGHQGGELASRMVVETLPLILTSELPASLNVDENQSIYALRKAIWDLSRLVHRKGSETPGLRGMGATIVACLIRREIATIAHMGDSRAYLLRKGFLEQLTEDHTI